MWIKTTTGTYVNSNHLQKILVTSSKLGGFNLTAILQDNDMEFLARFNDKADAQDFLNKFVPKLGERILEISMEDWNYTGHKKSCKETRHGGS